MGFLDWLRSSNLPPELLITDVTRMQGDRVCVAGIARSETVRLAEPAPTGQLLARLGGLSTGDVVRVKWTRLPRYRPPHNEDCRWKPTTLRAIQSLTPADLFARLQMLAFRGLVDAFGTPKYLAKRGNPVFHTDSGARSLASVIVRDLRVYRSGEGLRADFADEASTWRMLPVEGIAIHRHFEECKECSRSGEARAESAVLRVGLGRPFQPDGEQPGCFAQVNCIVPADPANSHFIEENHQ